MPLFQFVKEVVIGIGRILFKYESTRVGGRFRASKGHRPARGKPPGEIEKSNFPRTPSCPYGVGRAAAYAGRLWFELFCQGCFVFFSYRPAHRISGQQEVSIILSIRRT